MKQLRANNSEPDAHPVTAEYIPNPNRNLTLDVEKSKAYAKQILKDLDAKQSLELLNNQVLVKNLLINEAIIKQLEQLHAETDARAKFAIVQSIQLLTASATLVTQTKLALDKALGLGLLPHVPETASNPNPQAAPRNREMAAADFMSAYNAVVKK